MNEDFFILSMDIGGNIKYSVIHSCEEGSRIIISEQRKVRTLNETLWDMRQDLIEITRKTPCHLRYVLLSLPGACSLQFSTPSQALEETVRLIIKTFEPLSKEEFDILIIGRDGQFYNVNYVYEYCNKYPYEGYFFFDSYWRGAIDLSMDCFGLNTFLYLDMGSFSFTIIPVRDGEVIVEKHENRVLSEKLLSVGMMHTPLLFLMDEMTIDDVSFKPYAYVPLYTGDILKEEIDELLLCKLSRFLGYPHLNSNTAYKVISSLQAIMANFIRRKVKKHVELHYSRSDAPLVIAGSGKHLLCEILDSEHKYVLPMDNTHTCVGLAYVLLKKKYGRTLIWKESRASEE